MCILKKIGNQVFLVVCKEDIFLHIKKICKCYSMRCVSIRDFTVILLKFPNPGYFIKAICIFSPWNKGKKERVEEGRKRKKTSWQACLSNNQSSRLVYRQKMVFCYQNCSDLLWEKRLKFQAEGWEFSKILWSLEQSIQTVKDQNNFGM